MQEQHFYMGVDSMTKLIKSFASFDELITFSKHLDQLLGRIIALYDTVDMDNLTNDKKLNIISARVALFALFAREHHEVVRNLVANLDMREVTEEEMRDLQHNRPEDVDYIAL